MDTQENKNTQNDAKEELKALEAEAKSAFKADDSIAVETAIKKIQAIEPENRLAQKLTAKMEKAKAKEEAKAKAEKSKEYEGMLKKLYKENDIEKLAALAKEYKDFDPENKRADKWLQKSEKLQEKMSGKEEVPEKKEGEAEKKPGLLSSLFKKKDKPEEEKPEEVKMEVAESKPEEKPEMKEEVVAEAPKPEAPRPITPITPAPAAAPTTPAPTPIKPIQPITEAPKPTPAPEAPKPITPISPITPAPASKPVTPTTPPEMKSEEKKEINEEPKKEIKEEKGNIFTRMFKKKDEEMKKESIIDTIVAKTDKKNEVKEDKRKDEQKAIKEGEGQTLLTFSKVFMNFAVVFIALSATFLYVEWIDKDNTVLSIVGIQENTGLRLHNAADGVEQAKNKEEKLNEEIELYKGGYNDQALATVEKIIDERIDWPSIFAKINEVTNSVYELNDFFKYIEYNDYSFDAALNTVRVSGTLSDPLGRNLTKLVELEEAFMNYPRDKNNPEDTTKPYFIGFKEFNSFSKTLDIETGRYTSSFQLAFTLNE